MAASSGSGPQVLDPKLKLRRQLVADAIKNWVAQTIDLGGRNRLLYFRPLKRGTLDLRSASRDSADRLLRGLRVRISDLFEDDDIQKDAALRCRTIKKRADEYDQERGILTLRVGFGFATWKNQKSAATPNAPILLRDAVLTSIGRLADDFELQLINEWELNPSLVHALRTDFGVRLPSNEPETDIEDSPNSRTALEQRLQEVARQFSEVEEFRSTAGVVLANFTYTKIAQAIQLQDSGNEIADHELLSAIAGDPDARLELQQPSDGVAEISPAQIDQISPENEFLILDADSSQSIAIATALAGQNMVVVGPPGTGKSQTIANMIASYVAHGKRVLFVAEKRAAIEAVTKRLDQVGLGDLVLDMHGGASAKRKVAEDLNAALETTRKAVEPQLDSLHRNLSNTRFELNAYAEALHRVCEP
jgi:hypothetical protein